MAKEQEKTTHPTKPTLFDPTVENFRLVFDPAFWEKYKSPLKPNQEVHQPGFYLPGEGKAGGYKSVPKGKLARMIQLGRMTPGELEDEAIRVVDKNWLNKKLAKETPADQLDTTPAIKSLKENLASLEYRQRVQDQLKEFEVERKLLRKLEARFTFADEQDLFPRTEVVTLTPSDETRVDVRIANPPGRFDKAKDDRGSMSVQLSFRYAKNGIEIVAPYLGQLEIADRDARIALLEKELTKAGKNKAALEKRIATLREEKKELQKRLKQSEKEISKLQKALAQKDLEADEWKITADYEGYEKRHALTIAAREELLKKHAQDQLRDARLNTTLAQDATTAEARRRKEAEDALVATWWRMNELNKPSTPEPMPTPEPKPTPAPKKLTPLTPVTPMTKTPAFASAEPTRTLPNLTFIEGMRNHRQVATDNFFNRRQEETITPMLDANGRLIYLAVDYKDTREPKERYEFEYDAQGRLFKAEKEMEMGRNRRMRRMETRLYVYKDSGEWREETYRVNAKGDRKLVSVSDFDEYGNLLTDKSREMINLVKNAMADEISRAVKTADDKEREMLMEILARSAAEKIPGILGKFNREENDKLMTPELMLIVAERHPEVVQFALPLFSDEKQRELNTPEVQKAIVEIAADKIWIDELTDSEALRMIAERAPNRVRENLARTHHDATKRDFLLDTAKRDALVTPEIMKTVAERAPREVAEILRVLSEKRRDELATPELIQMIDERDRERVIDVLAILSDKKRMDLFRQMDAENAAHADAENAQPVPTLEPASTHQQDNDENPMIIEPEKQAENPAPENQDADEKPMIVEPGHTPVVQMDEKGNPYRRDWDIVSPTGARVIYSEKMVGDQWEKHGSEISYDKDGDIHEIKKWREGKREPDATEGHLDLHPEMLTESAEKLWDTLLKNQKISQVNFIDMPQEQITEACRMITVMTETFNVKKVVVDDYWNHAEETGINLPLPNVLHTLDMQKAQRRNMNRIEIGDSPDVELALNNLDNTSVNMSTCVNVKKLSLKIAHASQIKKLILPPKEKLEELVLDIENLPNLKEIDLSDYDKLKKVTLTYKDAAGNRHTLSTDNAPADMAKIAGGAPRVILHGSHKAQSAFNRAAQGVSELTPFQERVQRELAKPPRSGERD